MLATACKLDERQCDRTTLVHFRRLERYWTKFPPEHLIGRAFIKVKSAGGAVRPASKISPDHRGDKEKAADVARVAAARAKAPKRGAPSGGAPPDPARFMAAAMANHGQVNFDMLKALG